MGAVQSGRAGGDFPLLRSNIMALRLYNTMGRKMEEFKPIEEGHVGFYGCGPTVYNYAHIGNLRAYVFLDVL